MNNRFENVDLGKVEVSSAIAKYRRSIAETIESLIEDGAIKPETTVAEFVILLRKN